MKIIQCLIGAFFLLSFNVCGQAWITDSSLVVKCLNEFNEPYQHFSLKINGIPAEPCGSAADGPIQPGFYRIKPFTASNTAPLKVFIEASADGYLSLADSIYPSYRWGLFKPGDDYFYLTGNRVPKSKKLLSACYLAGNSYENIMDCAAKTGSQLEFAGNDCDNFFGEVAYGQYVVFSHPNQESHQNFRALVLGSLAVFETRGAVNNLYSENTQFKISNTGYFQFYYNKLELLNDVLKELKELNYIDRSSIDGYTGSYCYISVEPGKEYYFNEIFNILSERNLAFMCSVEPVMVACPD